jgi:thiamine biosynthesis lipoprotein
VPPEPAAPAGMARASFPAMGTEVTLLAPAGRVDEAAGRARRLFEDWERRLSRFRPDSELARLNAHAGRPVPVGALLYQVLETALAAAGATGGVYDPTMAHQLERLGYDRSFEQLPASSPRREAAGPGGGWRAVGMDPAARLVTLPPRVGVDLGGIAKGMAVDAATERLRDAGLAPVMVNAGGDLRVHGRLPGGGDWSIAIDGRRGRLRVPLAAGALATSGVARRRWSQGGEPRHHLLDPRTGEPALTGLWSVTAVAGSCAEAEVAAKVAFVLGRAAGAEFLGGRDLAGLFAGEGGEWWPAGAWPAWTVEAAAC